MIKRIILLLLVAATLLGIMAIFTYDKIKLDWISMMEIQSSFKPQEHPLPVAASSIPIEGPAYIPGGGAPTNPIKADEVSIQRGTELYQLNCVPCHGKDAKGDGVVGNFFKYKPFDLTSATVQQNSDGAIFLVISNGVEGRMPPMNENFDIRERWDLVNFIRTLAQKSKP